MQQPNFESPTVDPIETPHKSGREQLFECNTEKEVDKLLGALLILKGASTSTKNKWKKCAAGRIRDLRAQAATVKA